MPTNAIITVTNFVTHTLTNTVTMTNDALQILDKTHQFYNDEWTRLLTQISLLITGFGGGVAFLNYFFARSQKRNIADAQLVASKQITDEVKSAKESLSQEIKLELKKDQERESKRLEALIAEITKESKEEVAAAMGGVYFLQANQLHNRKLYSLALSNYANAAGKFFYAKEEVNFQRAIKRIIEGCLPNMNISDFNNKELFENDYKDLIDVLNKNNINGRYTDTISSLSHGIAEANKRNPPAPAKSAAQ